MAAYIPALFRITICGVHGNTHGKQPCNTASLSRKVTHTAQTGKCGSIKTATLAFSVTAQGAVIGEIMLLIVLMVITLVWLMIDKEE
jgi:hypothetical protein